MARLKKEQTTTAAQEKKEQESKAIAQVVNNKTGDTMIDPVSHRRILNLPVLEENLRNKVIEITNNLRQALADSRVALLKVGAYLLEAETLLKKPKLWVPYLNSFPNFKQAQAYRYINAYKAAKENYPAAVLDVILTTGMDIVGTKDAPWGKYTNVVKMLPPPKDVATDTGKATSWLNAVEAKYKEQRKTTAKVVTYDSLLQDAFNSVTAKLKKVPDKQTPSFVRDLFGHVMDHCGFTTQEYRRIPVPKEWKKEEETKKEEK